MELNDKSRDGRNIFFKILDDVCSDECATGFTALRLDSSIDYNCSKVCHNITINADVNSEEKLSQYDGCEIIHGFLEIVNLNRSFCDKNNFLTKFESFLSSIVEINGYLKIQYVETLMDLSSFKNLKRIGGKILESEKYALVITDNENLNDLWTTNSDVLIEGEFFIEYNPNLCAECQKLTNVQAYPNLYTVNITWNLPDNFESSKTYIYFLEVWNGVSKNACSLIRLAFTKHKIFLKIL